jgi:non-ribosomal peptide synthetase component F
VDLASEEARSAEGSANGGFFLSQANPHPQRDVIAKCFHPTGSFVEFKSVDVAQSIAARFEQQVARYPQRLAIKSKQRELTYCELNREANRIARSILAQRGPGQEAVALLLGDAAAMSSAILGALKAAKIYVPLDPTMPLPGLASIVENSQASTLLTDNSLLPLSRELCRQDILPINIDELASNPETENPGLSISPDYLAYILYTSGSTGKPKAVFQDHGNVLKKTLLYTNTAHISADDKFSLVAPFGFAAVMQSFFGSLLNGAALYPWKMQDEANLAEWLRAEEITIYRSAASVFRHLIDT